MAGKTRFTSERLNEELSKLFEALLVADDKDGAAIERKIRQLRQVAWAASAIVRFATDEERLKTAQANSAAALARAVTAKAQAEKAADALKRRATSLAINRVEGDEMETDGSSDEPIAAGELEQLRETLRRRFTELAADFESRGILDDLLTIDPEDVRRHMVQPLAPLAKAA